MDFSIEILTSAQQEITVAIVMLSARTPRDRITVHVKQDLLGMDVIAQVGLKSSTLADYYDDHLWCLND